MFLKAETSLRIMQIYEIFPICPSYPLISPKIHMSTPYYTLRPGNETFSRTKFKGHSTLLKIYDPLLSRKIIFCQVDFQGFSTRQLNLISLFLLFSFFMHVKRVIESQEISYLSAVLVLIFSVYDFSECHLTLLISDPSTSLRMTWWRGASRLWSRAGPRGKPQSA